MKVVGVAWGANVAGQSCFGQVGAKATTGYLNRLLDPLGKYASASPPGHAGIQKTFRRR